MNGQVLKAFSDELQKIAVSVPGMATPKSGLSVKKPQGVSVRPPTVPKIGVTAPKV